MPTDTTRKADCVAGFCWHMPEESESNDMFMEPFKGTAASEVLMQRLLVDVDLMTS